MNQFDVGPTGVHLSDDELLIIWQNLTRNANEENADIRRKIQQYLEHYREREVTL